MLHAKPCAHPPPRARYTAQIQLSARRRPHEHHGLPVLYRRAVSRPARRRDADKTRRARARQRARRELYRGMPVRPPIFALPHPRHDRAAGCRGLAAARGAVRTRRGRQSGRADRTASASGMLSVERRLLYQLSPDQRIARAAHARLFLLGDDTGGVHRSAALSPRARPGAAAVRRHCGAERGSPAGRVGGAAAAHRARGTA